MIIIADYECHKCKAITEHIVESGQVWVICPKCQGDAKRIITQGKVFLGNQDCDHVRSSVDALLDKDDHTPDAVKLRSHPTRDNLNRYMDKKGIKRMDYTEHGGPPAYRRPEEKSIDHLTAEVAQRRQERNRIEIHD